MTGVSAVQESSPIAVGHRAMPIRFPSYSQRHARWADRGLVASQAFDRACAAKSKKNGELLYAAIHEAGHAVAHIKLGIGAVQPMRDVSIVPQKGSSGRVRLGKWVPLTIKPFACRGGSIERRSLVRHRYVGLRLALCALAGPAAACRHERTRPVFDKWTDYPDFIRAASGLRMAITDPLQIRKLLATWAWGQAEVFVFAYWSAIRTVAGELLLKRVVDPATVQGLVRVYFFSSHRWRMARLPAILRIPGEVGQP